MRAVDLIARKRDGGAHTPEEIRWLISEYTSRRVPDYQMAAWLMAVVCCGLTDAETETLTEVMADSGRMLDLSGVTSVVADKHSTGGVGDKVTLVLAPVVAACGLPFAKISGRGLGHTGGTIDKLESIPGFRTDLSIAEFELQVEKIGVAVIRQTPDLVPADSLLYALRDATATVDSDGLIAASVMCKKIATGSKAIVLDVKVGEGALIADRERARRLAVLMTGIGTSAGRKMGAILTSMADPLGLAVGNALEVEEAMAFLRGAAPAAGTGPLREIVLALAGRLLALAGLVKTQEEGRRRAEKTLGSGDALEVCRRWIRAQSGDAQVVEGLGLPRSPVVRAVAVSWAGWVQRVRPLLIARACLVLGAGRATKESSIDPAVGVVLAAPRGSEVARGDALAFIHARTESDAALAEPMVREAFLLAPEPPQPEPVILEEL